MRRVMPTMSAKTLALNSGVISGVIRDLVRAAPLEAGASARESELQRECEGILEALGFLRLTAENAEAPDLPRGWYGHLVEARSNPLMPDLFIFDALGCRRPLFVELKTCGTYQRGQREMIERGQWQECRTVARFLEVLDSWIKPPAKRKGAR